MIAKKQWSYIRFWIYVVIVAEILMAILHNYLSFLYVVIALLFGIGFILRVFRVYPGKREPLILDSSAVIIALLYAYSADILKSNSLRFFLLATSSCIILPHIVYIYANKDL